LLFARRGVSGGPATRRPSKPPKSKLTIFVYFVARAGRWFPPATFNDEIWGSLT
jgi:hypothetical protein